MKGWIARYAAHEDPLVAGGNFVAPIMQRPDFERLEAKGVVTPGMKRLAEAIQAAVPAAQPTEY